MSNILRVKTPDFDYSCTTLADWRRMPSQRSNGAEIWFPERGHPICREEDQFWKKVLKAQKIGLASVLVMQENLKNPVKKANGKKIPPRPAAVISHVPAAAPVVVPEPISRPVPAFGSPEVVVMVKYPAWPGWQTVKALRANGYRWNAKARAHEKAAPAEILNSIN